MIKESEITRRKDEIRELFPIGTRVRIIKLVNEEKTLPIGTVGTVIGYDSGLGQGPHILMKWDNGSSLKLLYYEGDKVEIIT